MSEHETIAEPMGSAQMNGESPANGSGQDMQGASLDQVRELLFGQQVRTTDQRLGKLEEKINEQMKAFQEQTRRALGALEGYFKKEVESVLERLQAEAGARESAVKAEAQERAAALRAAGEQAKAASEQWHNRVGELEGRMGDGQRKVREELHEQTKTLREELAQSQHEVVEMLEMAVAELKRGKTDRAVLAEMFGQLAERLNGAEAQPGVRLAQG